MKKEDKIKVSAVATKKKSATGLKAKKVAAEKAYLTKRVLLSAVNKGIKSAAARTMQVQGYTVIAEDGWVVRVNANGEKERIKRIVPATRAARITLR